MMAITYCKVKTQGEESYVQNDSGSYVKKKIILKACTICEVIRNIQNS